MKEIEISKIINDLDKYKIIDIRDSYIYNLDSIPNSINIPKNFLIMNPENYLNVNDTYYIYCSYGVTSKEVCKILTNKGYDVVNIIGGFNEYKLKKHIFKD